MLTAIGLFGYLEEYYSFLVVKSFTKLLPSYTNVIRDGVRSRVRTDQLVPGDVVLVCAGDVVPADLRIIEINIGSPLKTDMSNLTGESDAVYRSDQPTNENPLETRNLLFYSNRVVEGSAKCIVLFTGTLLCFISISIHTMLSSSEEIFLLNFLLGLKLVRISE